MVVIKKETIDLDKIDFFGLMAHAANEQKQKLVIQLLELARTGDAAALRLLEKALIEQKPMQEKNKPIPILGGITQQQNVRSNDSPIQNPRSEKKT